MPSSVDPRGPENSPRRAGEHTRAGRLAHPPRLLELACAMPLPAEVLEQISVLVRARFDEKRRLLEIFGEELYEPGELSSDEVSLAIDEEEHKLAAEEARWPEVTDCDRVGDAFSALHARGVIALENAGYTTSDGYDDFREAYAQVPDRSRVIGYCYYHGQDVERAVRGGGLYIAFGPVDAKKEETEGPRIGGIVKEELERVGLVVEWNGTFGQRIHVPMRWQRRARRRRGRDR